MRQFVRLLGRFRRDERGVFGIIFALIAIVIIAMAGAAVDYTSVQQARTKAQVALDAAALALQPTIYTSTASAITPLAEALLVNRLADPAHQWGDCTTPGTNIIVSTPPCVTMGTTQIDTTAGTLTLTASLKLPMNFVSLVGISQMQAQIVSVATRQKLNLEVAMALDNSGSMAYTMGQNAANGPPTRMDTLHTAATCAVNILMYNVTSCTASTTGLTVTPNVKIGIVPFTEAVNAGASLPSADIDRSGVTVINGVVTPNGNPTTDNFDYNGTTPGDYYATPGDEGTGVDRVGLFSEMKDSSGNAMSWQGCLQARASPYDVDATPPSAATPATLYTPYFAVDEPDSNHTSNGDTFYNNYIADAPATKPPTTATACVISSTCTITTVKKGNNSPTTTYSQVAVDNETSTSSCSCSGYTTTTTTKTSGSTTTTTQVCTIPFQPANLTPQKYQGRLCKYNGAKMTGPVNGSQVFGPNGDCPAATVQPLNATPSTIVSAITAMQAVGGTNITEGAVWGLRLLSPVDPFDAQPFGAATSKNLIIMTDGANTIYPGSNMNDDTYNSAYGFPINGRLLPTSVGTSTLQNANSLQAQMDTNLSTVCTNAKNAGITVYIIGIDVADSESTSAASATNKTNLTNCGSPGDAYFPNDATTLVGDFQAIANQLAALRLSK